MTSTVEDRVSRIWVENRPEENESSVANLRSRASGDSGAKKLEESESVVKNFFVLQKEDLATMMGLRARVSFKTICFFFC